MSLADDISSLFPGSKHVERFTEDLEDDYEEEVRVKSTSCDEKAAHWKASRSER